MSDQEAAPEGPENFRWRTAEGGPTTAGWIVIGILIAVVVLGFGAWWTFGLGRGMPSGTDMSGGGMEMEGGAQLPAVHGYYGGQDILFVHTEASDQQVADMLSGMMGSPVVVVPSLAEVPDSAVGNVFVFRNGVQPDGPRGPFGFQPDVFDSAPGDQNYSPLRQVVLVTWRDEAGAQVLRSAEDVEAAGADGRLATERPGVVVNMPFLTWPGGAR
ncbi:MAG: hypothetical protein WD830_05155 [Chloroflexota bacterium]